MSLDRFSTDAVSRNLEAEARKFASRSVADNLHSLLWQYDFSRNEIAAIASVSCRQVSDWRNGRGVDSLQRAQPRFCRLLGVISLLSDGDVVDPGSWLRSPILRGQNPSRMQLFYQGQEIVLGLLGLGAIDSEEAFGKLRRFENSNGW